MGFRILFFILIFVSPSVDAKPEFYDFHFHVSHQTSHKNLNEALDNENNFFKRKGVILLDTAYNLPVVQANFGPTDKGDDITPMELHTELNQLSQGSKIPSFGLCGANLSDPNVVEQVEECLSLKQMKGVKLHMHIGGNLLSTCSGCLPGFEDSLSQKLDQVAQKVGKKRGLILIHFTHLAHFDPMTEYGAFGTQRAEEVSEAKAFLDVAINNPKVKFIMAHSGINSMVNPGSFALFGDYFRQNPEAKKNIYVETSVVVGHVDSNLCFMKNLYEVMANTRERIHPISDAEFCSQEIGQYSQSPESLQVIEAWRELGMTQILFGTDGPSEALVLESLQYILTNPYLSPREKQQILNKNGQKVFESLF